MDQKKKKNHKRRKGRSVISKKQEDGKLVGDGGDTHRDREEQRGHATTHWRKEIHNLSMHTFTNIRPATEPGHSIDTGRVKVKYMFACLCVYVFKRELGCVCMHTCS